MNRLARRQRAALALFIALTVSGVGVAMAAPQSGDQPGRTLDVSPNDGQNLAESQQVTVTGAGFPANTNVLVVQSAFLPNGTTAVSATLATVTTNASGGFTANATVTRTFSDAGSGQTIDCNAANVTCSVEAFSTSGNANSRHTISFASGGTTVPTTVTTVPTTVTTVPTTVTTVPTTVTTVPTTVTTVPTTVTTVPTTVTTVPTTVITVPTTVITVPTTVITVPTTVITVPTTVITVPTTVTTVPTTVTTVPTTVTTVPTVPTTTLVDSTLCALIRAARAQLNAQIDAARAAITQLGLSAEQQAGFLAQLEGIRTQGNAQLDALLVGCPTT